MTPPSTPIDAHDAVARPPRIATPLNLLIVLASVFVAVVWLITLQRIAFEREQALTAEMKANSSLAIAFEQQVFRALKAAEQVAAFVREQYRRQGKAIPAPLGRGGHNPRGDVHHRQRGGRAGRYRQQ